MFTLLNVYELKFKKNTIPYNVRHVHVYTIALKSTSHSGKKKCGIISNQSEHLLLKALKTNGPL